MFYNDPLDDDYDGTQSDFMRSLDYWSRNKDRFFAENPRYRPPGWTPMIFTTVATDTGDSPFPESNRVSGVPRHVLYATEEAQRSEGPLTRGFDEWARQKEAQEPGLYRPESLRDPDAAMLAPSDSIGGPAPNPVTSETGIRQARVNYHLENPGSSNIFPGANSLTQEQLTAILYNENAGLRGAQIDDANLAVGNVALARQQAGKLEKYGKGKDWALPKISDDAMRDIANGNPDTANAYLSAADAAHYLYNAPGSMPPMNYQGFNHRNNNSTSPRNGDPTNPLMLQYGPFYEPGSRIHKYINVYRRG